MWCGVLTETGYSGIRSKRLDMNLDGERGKLCLRRRSKAVAFYVFGGLAA